MNSGTQEANLQKQETSAMGRFQAVEFTLTPDQFAIIQHFLPKMYVLEERKSTKREKGSNHKLMDAEMSKFSGGFDNNEQIQGRSKRVRTKKIDRYLEEETPRVTKRNQQKISFEEEMSNCTKILTQLKKHPQSQPFHDPVDPKKSGASHYFDIIKEPMDLSRIEKKLKAGDYHSSNEFHMDVGKVWNNSFAYNQKTSKIYKVAVQMQKFYKKLIAENNQCGSHKRQNLSKNKNKNLVDTNLKGEEQGDDVVEGQDNSSSNKNDYNA